MSLYESSSYLSLSIPLLMKKASASSQGLSAFAQEARKLPSTVTPPCLMHCWLNKTHRVWRHEASHSIDWDYSLIYYTIKPASFSPGSLTVTCLRAYPYLYQCHTNALRPCLSVGIHWSASDDVPPLSHTSLVEETYGVWYPEGSAETSSTPSQGLLTPRRNYLTKDRDHA